MRLNTLNIAAKLALSFFLITILLGAISASTLIGLLYSEYEAGFHIPDMEKIKVKYGDPLIVGAMKTSMYKYVADDADIAVMARWIKNGAKEDDYFEEEVMYIISEDCQKCHSRTATMTGAIQSMPLSGYEDILNYTDAGYSWTRMAKAAHIHLFGISVFLLLVSFALAFSSYRPMLKNALIITGWLTLWLDIASWWLAKFSDLFAYLIAFAGTLEVGVIAVMCGLCLMDLWLKIPDAFVEQRSGGK